MHDDGKELYSGHRKRLRKKFADCGADAFSDYEQLELLLTYSIPRKDVKPAAKMLLKRFETLAGVLDAGILELAGCENIGINSAILIKLVRDLKTGYYAARTEDRKKIQSAREAEDFIISAIAGCSDEKFLAIFLDTKNRMIHHEIMFEGTLNQTAVYPRKILEAVIARKASSIIIAHNHPSGDTTPSREDIAITSKIKTACSAADITLLDHIIAGKGNSYSFFQNGLL